MAIQNFGSGGGFQLSPGINVSEIDLTTSTGAVDTTTGAFAGVFRWGPIGQLVRVSSENDLAIQMGKPHSINPETWFTAANFLGYSNSLVLSRAANTQLVVAAVASEVGFPPSQAVSINNDFEFDAKYAALQSTGIEFIAKYSGALGNSLKVSVCDSPEAFAANINLRTVNTAFDYANTQFTLDVGSRVGYIELYSPNTAPFGTTNTPIGPATAVADKFKVGDFIEAGNEQIGRQSLKIIGKNIIVANTNGANTGSARIELLLDQPYRLSDDFASSSLVRQWEYFNQVSRSPSRTPFVEVNGDTAGQYNDPLYQLDELHVVVVDEDGEWTGAPGSVLEVFEGMSRATDARLSDGTSNFYKNVINNRSQYIRAGSDRNGSPSATALLVQTSTNVVPYTMSLTGGVDQTEDSVEFGNLARAYDFFNSKETSDVSLVLQGKARGGVQGEQLANYLIDNIVEQRKDCVAFVSPQLTAVLNQPNTAVQNILNFRAQVRSSSYAVMDTGYKYQYDKYNDVFRWIPLNGDMAGLCARTDGTRDPWYSPAGTTRGQIKNVIRLAFNPSARSQRDVLYTRGVNPVVSEQGSGTYLNGDKTLLNQNSAFNRINVRRLFIVLQKVISESSKSLLFEFNDEFTRAQFINIVEPFLRDVEGRRGITEFRVVCDASNNTPQVVDSNTLVGDIYIKPARSINFIQLNFVGTRTGVEFSELVS